MLSNHPIKIKGGTTRGVVLISLLLSLLAFSGFDSRSPSREIPVVKTELVAKIKRYATRTTLYAVAGQKSIFDFIPFHEIEFLRFQGNLIETKAASVTRQNIEFKETFNRYPLIYPSLSMEEDIIESLPG